MKVLSVASHSISVAFQAAEAQEDAPRACAMGSGRWRAARACHPRGIGRLSQPWLPGEPRLCLLLGGRTVANQFSQFAACLCLALLRGAVNTGALGKAGCGEPVAVLSFAVLVIAPPSYRQMKTMLLWEKLECEGKLCFYCFSTFEQGGFLAVC